MPGSTERRRPRRGGNKKKTTVNKTKSNVSEKKKKYSILLVFHFVRETARNTLRVYCRSYAAVVTTSVRHGDGRRAPNTFAAGWIIQRAREIRDFVSSVPTKTVLVENFIRTHLVEESISVSLTYLAEQRRPNFVIATRVEGAEGPPKFQEN